tara:strand:- start:122 stop:517 length:396 start_codon:yes stop_codon:yes gene_type:complete
MVDTEKWKKKFKFLLDREKILSFDSVEGSFIFSRKGIMTTLEPKVLKKGFGDQIMQENTKFWILFTNYNKQKVTGSDVDQKERVRRQIVDNFFEIDNPSKENQEILKKYLDDILYLPDIIQHSKFVYKSTI